MPAIILANTVDRRKELELDPNFAVRRVNDKLSKKERDRSPIFFLMIDLRE